MSAHTYGSISLLFSVHTFSTIFWVYTHTHTLTRTHTHTRTPTQLHTLTTPLRTLALAVAHCSTLTLLYSQLTQSHTHTWALTHSCTHAFMHSRIFSKECKLPTKCMIHISSLLCSKFHSLWLQNFPLRGSSSRSWGEPKYHSCGRSYKQIFRHI